MRSFSFVCLALLCFGLPVRADRTNGIVCVVNDSVITYGEVQLTVAPVLDSLARQYGEESDTFKREASRIFGDGIKALVEQKLILNEFKTTSHVPDKVVDKYVENEIRDHIQKEYYGDRSLLTKSLQKEGVTYETYVRHVREQFIVRELRREYVSMQKVLISPAKIEAYYKEHLEKFKINDQVKLRMIVLNQAADAPAGAARKLADEILGKIEEGVPFAEMAGVYSSGSQRAEGGDRGWQDRSYFNPAVGDVAFSLKPGQHSKVIETPGACYLIFVEDIRPAHVREISEVRSEIEQTLKSEEQNRLARKWIERLTSKSFVQYF